MQQQQFHLRHTDFDDGSSYTPMRGMPDNQRVTPGDGSQASPLSHHGRQPSSLTESSPFDGRSLRSNSDVGSFGGESTDHWSMLSVDEPPRPMFYHPQISDMEEVHSSLTVL